MGGGTDESLADRVRATREREERNQRHPDEIRHVWVTTEHGRYRGLHLEWRKTEVGWESRCVHPMPDQNGWTIIEMWLPAALVELAQGG